MKNFEDIYELFFKNRLNCCNKPYYPLIILISRKYIHRRENEYQIHIIDSILLIFKDNVRKLFYYTEY